METIILYSTGCPRCNVLETKLDQKGIKYTKTDDITALTEKGFTTAPVLQVGENFMDFPNAVAWVNKQA